LDPKSHDYFRTKVSRSGDFLIRKNSNEIVENHRKKIFKLMIAGEKTPIKDDVMPNGSHPAQVSLSQAEHAKTIAFSKHHQKQTIQLERDTSY
jgi:hypothetical protein